MSTPINYLDLTGVTNLKNEIDNRYATTDSVNTIVNLIKSTIDTKVDATDFVPITKEQIATLFADPTESKGEEPVAGE